MKEVAERTRDAIFHMAQDKIKKSVEYDTRRVVEQHRVGILYDTYDLVFNPTWTLLTENIDEYSSESDQ